MTHDFQCACGVKVQRVTLWPLKCVCGRTYKDSSTQLTDERRGVGTTMTELIRRWIRIKPEQCGCKSLAREMDAMGPDWCEANREILIDRMLANATKMRLKRLALLSDSQKRTGIGKLLNIAIARTRRKQE